MRWTVVPKTEDGLRFITKVDFVPHFKTGEKIDWHNYTAIALEFQRIGEPFYIVYRIYSRISREIYVSFLLIVRSSMLCLVLQHRISLILYLIL